MNIDDIVQEDPENIERWIISYADLLTLLFAFFVVMYAISTVNMRKYRKLTHSLHAVFSDRKNSDSVYLSAKKIKYSAPFQSQGDIKLPGFNEGNFKRIMDDDMIKIKTINRDWAEIELRSHLAFNSGDADLRIKAVSKLKEIGALLKKTEYKVIVEGYTDNVPISTVIFPSNWELSAARAAAVVRVLTSGGVPAKNLTAVGYADQYPVASNSSAKGREQNRRVLIVIVRSPNVERVLNPEAKVGGASRNANNADDDIPYRQQDPGYTEEASMDDDSVPEKPMSTGKRASQPSRATPRQSVPTQKPLPSGVEVIRPDTGGMVIRKAK